MQFFPEPSLKMVIAIEYAWLDRLLATPLYRYEMPQESFVDCHDHGVHVSQAAMESIDVVRLRPSLELLAEHRVELRVMPSLVEIAERMSRTSLHWSNIRMRNAIGSAGQVGRPTIPAGIVSQ